MARFIYLHLKKCLQQEHRYQWRMVISTVDELLDYSHREAEANMGTYFGMERIKDTKLFDVSHKGATDSRTYAIGQMLNTKILSTPEGETIHPIIEIANITDRKIKGMYDMIQRGHELVVNTSGGWCLLKGFVDTWECEIIDDITIQGFGFPSDKSALNVDTIILENASSRFKKYDTEFLNKIPDLGTYEVLYDLKELDMRYIFHCLQNCKNVVIESELMDDNQVGFFLSAFLKLERKNVYLFLQQDVEAKLRSHSLFEKNNQLHNIKISR